MPAVGALPPAPADATEPPEPLAAPLAPLVPAVGALLPPSVESLQAARPPIPRVNVKITRGLQKNMRAGSLAEARPLPSEATLTGAPDVERGGKMPLRRSPTRARWSRALRGNAQPPKAHSKNASMNGVHSATSATPSAAPGLLSSKHIQSLGPGGVFAKQRFQSSMFDKHWGLSAKMS
jgi:hypothetical protein